MAMNDTVVRQHYEEARQAAAVTDGQVPPVVQEGVAYLYQLTGDESPAGEMDATAFLARAGIREDVSGGLLVLAAEFGPRRPPDVAEKIALLAILVGRHLHAKGLI
jgi:hypothetical protein